MDHIHEIRRRLMWSAAAVLVFTIFAFFFANQLFDIMIYPAHNVSLVYLEVTAMLSIYMKVCLTAGIIAAMPVLIYHFIMFVAPGLTPKEKKCVLIVVPWIFAMFLAGAAFGYFLFLPKAITFLTTFANDIAAPMIRIDSYIDFLTRMLLALGLIFEMPVIMTFLGRLGIVSPKWLVNKWKIAIILAFVVAAIVTPTTDPLNMMIFATPIIILYGMSIWLVWLVQKKKPETTALTDNQ
jgi:sec-independent protein translocase protein TatC